MEEVANGPEINKKTRKKQMSKLTPEKNKQVLTYPRSPSGRWPL